MSRRLVTAATALALVVAACSSNGNSATTTTSGSTTARRTAAPAATAAAIFAGHGGIRYAYVLDAPPSSPLVLADAQGSQVATTTADAGGSAVFHDVAPGAGYTIRARQAAAVLGTKPFAVTAEAQTPPASLYDQTMQAGLNYVTMRDGVELAMTVRLPAGKQLSDGPFPTVVEYSGYQVAAPHDLLGDVVARLTNPNTPSDPLVPDTSTAVGSLIAPVLGFASVSVQMRGTGCSGGAFDLFDYPTIYDGYDAIETVAHQSWVKGHKVGMVGISFSGITQLLVGGTRPPHLAALAPLSVTDDLYRTVGYPGGMFNRGFAKSWLQERVDDAKPAPEGGQRWAKALVKSGDQHCIANQKLHSHTLDVFGIIQTHPFRDAALLDHRAPEQWAAKIDVPTYIVGAFQDEQIVSLEPTLVQALSKNPKVWVTLQNGTHVDSLGPGAITRWAEFLKIYVADELPKIPDLVLALGGQLYNQIASAPAAPIAQSKLADLPSVAAARAAFEKYPRVRVLMDNGGGDAGAGALQPVWEMDFTDWPPPAAQARAFYLGAHGALSDAAPSATGEDHYVSDATARPDTSMKGDAGNAWLAQPPYDWKPVVAGKGLGYVTPVLDHDLVVAGPGSLDVYLKSSAADTDLQVTVSEVRPDGKENYVQSGFLRASMRQLDPARSSAIQAVPTFAQADAAPLPAGKWTLVRIPILPVAYAFRAGSRLRISITAPGGDRPAWKFDTTEHGQTTDTIGLGGAVASKLMLAVLPDQTAGAPRPACGADRGSPCRTYAPATNGG